MTEDTGIIIRGKYTFEIKFTFPIRLLLASVSAFEKNCHGNIAAYTIMAYGADPVAGNLANLLKTKVNTSIVSNGRKILHKAPTTVCLYRTLISRQLSI